MIDLDEGDSELARWKHQTRLLERENRTLQAENHTLREQVQKLLLDLALVQRRARKTREAVMAEERAACAAVADERAQTYRTSEDPWAFEGRTASVAIAAAIQARGAR